MIRSEPTQSSSTATVSPPPPPPPPPPVQPSSSSYKTAKTAPTPLRAIEARTPPSSAQVLPGREKDPVVRALLQGEKSVQRHGRLNAGQNAEVKDGAIHQNTRAKISSTEAPYCLNAQQQQKLAQRYAPILHFHPEEKNFLQDPSKYIEQSSLRQERDFRPDKEVYGQGEVPPQALAGIDKGNEKADGQLFLDHRERQSSLVTGPVVAPTPFVAPALVMPDSSDDPRKGDLSNSKNLYQYDSASNTMTYHLFYSYNDGPPGVGDVQNHEGDWERITVQLDRDFKPTEVRYSAHNGLDVSRSWAEAPKENGRPVSFVGQGSHANFPETGRWKTDFPSVSDIAAAGGRRYDLAQRPAVDVTSQPWYGGHVLWGERGSTGEIPKGIPKLGDVSGMTSGPTGPSADKGPILEADPRQPLPTLGERLTRLVNSFRNFPNFFR